MKWIFIDIIEKRRHLRVRVALQYLLLLERIQLLYKMVIEVNDQWNRNVLMLHDYQSVFLHQNYRNKTR